MSQRPGIFFALMIIASLVAASPAWADKLKFVYVYNTGGQLLTPLNAANQCPDPSGGNGAADVCRGVAVGDDGDYSLRMDSDDLSNDANLVLVANEYHFVAAGARPGVTEDTYVLRESKRRVDGVVVDTINGSLDINAVSEATVHAVEEVHRLPQGRRGTVGAALGELLNTLDADALNRAMGNGRDDNEASESETQRQRELVRLRQDELSEREQDALDQLATLAVQYADDPRVSDYLRRNVVQALADPDYLSETVDRVFSHVAALQAAGAGEGVLILDADRYVMYPQQAANLSTARSLNPDAFFAYTWTGVDSETTTASFAKNFPGSYLVCATGEMNTGNDSSTDCLRLLVKDEVEAVAIASERRVPTGAEVMLSARYSVGATRFAWSGSDAITDPNASTTTWTAPQTPGLYNLTLSINDGEDSDSVTIEVFDILPVAIAEADREAVYLGDADSSIRFTSGSISTDGTPVDGLSWQVVEQPAGANPVLSGASAETFVLDADVAGLYTIRLTATRNGSSDATELVVQVRERGAPVAIAGPDQVAFRGQSVGLDGSYSYGDIGTRIAFNWSADVGSIADPASATTTYSTTAVGLFPVTLTVSDGQQSASDSLSVEVRNRVPVANDDLIQHDMKQVYQGQLPAMDADGDSLVYSMVTEIGSGSVTIDAGTGRFVYIPGGSQGCRFSPYQQPLSNGQGGLDVPVIKLCADKTRVAPGEVVTLSTSNSISASRFSGFEWNVDVTPIDATTFSFVSAEPGAHHVCITGNVGQGGNTSTACVDVVVDGSLDWGACGIDYSEPGLVGGHFDVDTSDFVASDNDGSTGKHTHEYDDEFNVNGVDAFDMRDRHRGLASVIDPDQKFKIVSINADLSPGARIAINSDYSGLDAGSYQLAADYDDIDLASLPVYSLSGVDGTIKLDSLGVYFERLDIVNGKLHPTNTGAVRSNVPGKLGEWRNGAYVLQVVAVNDDGSDAFVTDVSRSRGGVQGVASDGLLWELTMFWHWQGPGYHQPDWDGYDPTGEVDEVHNEIGDLVRNTDCTLPESNFADSFQYRVNDGYDNSNVGTIWFNVGWVNSLPTLDDVALSTAEDTPLSGRFTATDIDAQTLTYSIGDSPLLGTVNIDAATGDYTYTPNANVNVDLDGTDSFTVLVHDGVAFSAPATVTVTITPVNDAPVAFFTGSLSTTEETPVSGVLGASDVDGDALDIRLVVQGARGDVVISDAQAGTFTYNPRLDAQGSDSFYFVVNDGTLDSNLAQVLVDIAPVNDAPTAANIGPLTAYADTALSGQLAGSDVDGDALAYRVVANPAKGTVDLDPQSGVFTFTPGGAQLGVDSFSYRVSDGALESAVATVSLDILPANVAPVANDQVIDVVEGVAYGGTLTGSDAEGAALSFALERDGVLGSVTISGVSNGEFEYTASAAGSDSFGFTVNDGSKRSAAGNVTVNVISAAVFCAGPASLPVDADGDGYADFVEAQFGTAANDASVTPFGMDPVASGVSFLDDDDGDAYLDYVELWLGSGYTDSTSRPSASRLNNLPACMSVAGDRQPPALQAFNVLTPVVDIDSAPAASAARFAFTALDNAAGVAAIDVTLTSPSGAELAARLTVTDASKVLYAEFDADLFSRYAEAGSWAVSELKIRDALGNELLLTHDDLLARGFDHELTVVNSLGDAVKPAVDLFDVLTPTVDLTAGDSVARFRVDASDSPAGIGRIGVRLQSPSGSSYRWAETRLTGNQTSVSVNIDSNAFDPFAEPGAWTVSELEIVDEAGNKRAYTTAELTASGYPVTVTVISNLDATAPALDFFEVITDVVDTAPGDVQAGFNLTVSDGQSGVKQVVVTLMSPSGFVLLGSHSALDPSASLSIRIDAEAFVCSAEVGVWVVSQVDVVDASGNVSSYGSADLGAAGFESQLRVRSNIGCNAPNNAPLAEGMSIVTDEDVAVSGTLIATDEDGQALTFTLVGDGELGSAKITDSASGAFTYTPRANAYGSDSFTFMVDDGIAESSVATVMVTINPLPDAPAGRDLQIEVLRNTLFNGALYGEDADGDAISFSIDTNGSLGTATISDASSGAFSYMPNADALGEDSFSYVVSDGGLTSVVNTVTVRIKPEFGVGGFTVLTPSVSNGDASVWLIAEARMSIGNSQIEAAWVTLTGPSGQSIPMAAINLSLDDDSPVTLAAQVDPLAVNLEAGVWTFNNLRALRKGSAASILVADDIGAAGFADEVLVIGNTSPVASNDSITTPMGTSYLGTLRASDADGDALSYRLIGNGSPGEVTLLDASTGEFRYTPLAIGTGSFSFQVNDGRSDAVVRGVVSVTVTTPAALEAFDASFVVSRNVALVDMLSASAPNGDALTYSVVDGPRRGRINLIDASTGAFAYHPEVDFVGADSFTFKVNDGAQDSNIATVSLSVVVPNASPAAGDETITVLQNTPRSGSVNAVDPDGDALNYQLLSAGSLGSAVLDASTGAYTYTPNAGALGRDFFSYSVSDGVNSAVQVTVWVDIVSLDQACGAGGIVAGLDADADGWADAVEAAFGTAIDDATDTPAGLDGATLGVSFTDDDDGDGIVDYQELWLGSDKDDAGSVPELYLAACFSVASDGIKPRLLGFRPATPSVDLNGGDTTVSFDMTLLDNASGIRRARIGLLSPSGVLVTRSLSYDSYPLLAGLRLTSEPLGEFAEAGNWTITGLTLFDEAGNRLNLGSDDLAAAGFATEVVVTNSNGDATGPSLDDFVITRPTVYPGTGVETMSFSLTLSDSGAGVSSARVDMVGPSGVVVSAVNTLATPAAAVTLSLDTPVLSPNLEQGTWNVLSVLVVDAAGNSVEYVDRLATMGFATSLQSTNPQSDATAPQLDSFAVLTPTALPAGGDAVMRFSVGVSDDLSGVARVRIDLRGPSGQLLYAWGEYSATLPLSDTAQVETPVLSTLLEAGSWTVEAVEVIDGAGNRSRVDAGALTAAGMDSAVIVSY